MTTMTQMLGQMMWLPASLLARWMDLLVAMVREQPCCQEGEAVDRPGMAPGTGFPERGISEDNPLARGDGATKEAKEERKMSNCCCDNENGMVKLAEYTIVSIKRCEERILYKGEIVMPNPASSGTGYLSVASILQRMKEAEGWKYLDALDKNMAEYTKSGSKPCKDAAAGERAVGVSFEYVAMKMKKDGAPVEMVLPKEGSGYEIEANGLTKKGKSNAAAKQFLDWAISDEAMALYAKYFAAVSVAGFPVPEGLPKDISKVVYPNDFDWSAKNRDRILAEWSKRYQK